ncbi:MAG: alanine--tRNA ligase-related protein, partial [Candidatus Omnitrophica bacterium]|nr:alanine--tRNA ligase-related protein [Candidatus Omnitrophota bacterium]
SQIVLAEEERFRDTLEEGLNILNGIIMEVKRNNSGCIEGKDAFKLYDTCGFPLELTELVSCGEGLKVDKEGFNLEMEKQKKRSRDGSSMKGDVFSCGGQVLDVSGLNTEFLGYNSYDSDAEVRAVYVKDSSVDSAEEGDLVGIVLDKTPFYAEQGGQVSDQGKISSSGLIVEIYDVKKMSDAVLHSGKVIKGKLRVGDRVSAKVDMERRLDIARNHTATHILQSALREVLGSHVEQAGSWVGPDSLRFDFTHFKAIDREQIERVEELVNNYIRRNDKVVPRVMDKSEAQKSGALAFFGEKYGDKVRVVNVGDYSKEFCGGTHLDQTGQIGLLLIISEFSVAQGVRRIEAVTGRGAHIKVRNLYSMFKDISGKYKIHEEKIPGYIVSILERAKSLEKDFKNVKLENFKKVCAATLIEDAIKKEKQFGGRKVISEQIDEPVEILRQYMDVIRERSGENTFIFLSSACEGKSFVLIGISGDLIKDFDAVLAARKVAELIEGSGGGKRDLAQAGSKDTQKLKLLKDPEVLNKIIEAAES